MSSDAFPPDDLPRLPAWAGLARGAGAEDAAFAAGAALAALDQVMARADIPHALLRARLALRASEACMGIIGRPERAADLRDVVHLLRAGERPGPAGEVFALWTQVVARPLTARSLARVLPDGMAVPVAQDGGPVERAARTLGMVLADAPRAEVAALILADAALARALGWGHVVPLLAAGLAVRDLRLTGDDLRLACLRALVGSAREALSMAGDLRRRAARLTAVRPRLRAKGAGRAVDLLLARDALSPSIALSGPGTDTGLSDRAARRLCERLVSLGAVREVTGRATFRLYGV